MEDLDDPFKCIAAGHNHGPSGCSMHVSVRPSPEATDYRQPAWLHPRSSALGASLIVQLYIRAFMLMHRLPLAMHSGCLQQQATPLHHRLAVASHDGAWCHRRPPPDRCWTAHLGGTGNSSRYACLSMLHSFWNSLDSGEISRGTTSQHSNPIYWHEKSGLACRGCYGSSQALLHRELMFLCRFLLQI